MLGIKQIMHNDRYRIRCVSLIRHHNDLLMKHDHTLRFTAQLKKKNAILQIFQLSFQKISLYFFQVPPTIAIDTITGSKFL